jgi:hypothetical protein
MAARAAPALDRATLRAVARQVAEVLGRHDDALLTAREVAARLNVDRSWVYAHAEDLGVVRLGQGPRPRLRFDAAVVAQRVLAPPGRTSAASPSIHAGAGASLLPIRSPRRPRRTLGPGG